MSARGFLAAIVVGAVLSSTVTAIVVAGTAPPAAAHGQQLDPDVPPGNPVVGSDAPGDAASGDRASYVLLAILACCLIGAGVLLVKVERWEKRRSDQAGRARSVQP